MPYDEDGKLQRPGSVMSDGLAAAIQCALPVFLRHGDEAEDLKDDADSYADWKTKFDKHPFREALEHIAKGNISPSISFAEHILAGCSLEEAHKKGSPIR